MMPSAEVYGGVDIKNLSPGSLVDVETKSRHYQIECLGGKAVRISGHPRFCPQPTLAEVEGSATAQGQVEVGKIQPGKHLVFLVGKNVPVTTSEVLNVHVQAAA